MSSTAHLSDNQLSDLLDNRLGDSEQQVAQAHLATCEACADKLQALTRVGIALRAEAIPAAPPDLQARIRKQLGPHRGLPRWSYGVAAVLVAGTMLTMLFRDRSAVPTSTRTNSEAARTDEQVSDEQKDALRSLGYVGNTPVFDEPYPPAKRPPADPLRDQKLATHNEAAKPEPANSAGESAAPRAVMQDTNPEVDEKQDSQTRRQAPMSSAPVAPPEMKKERPATDEESRPAPCVEFDPAVTLRSESDDGASFLTEFLRITGSAPRVEPAADGNGLIVSVPRDAWERFRNASGKTSLPVTPELAECVRFRLVTSATR
ncbi:MAG: zf-HC2 domain-containing protein [Acidobacteriota bacterium]